MRRLNLAGSSRIYLVDAALTEDGVDLALVRRAAAGEADAYEALVRERMTGIYRLCLGILGHEADAADATQEALVSAWRELPRLRDEASFDPWLRRIAYNACRAVLRRRRGIREIPVEAAIGLGRLEPRHIDYGGDLGELFAHLPLEQRSILVLHHLEGCSLAEIAGVLNVPVGTVKSRLFAARKSLAAAVGLAEQIP